MKNLPRPLRNFLYKFFVFRLGIIYAYSCLEYPLTGNRIWWAYVGQTRQELIDRHNQHMGAAGYRGKSVKGQPWSDLAPEVRIEVKLYCPDAILDLIEKFYIHWYKPTYNYIHNTRNSDRIPKYIAKAQREDRDRLLHVRKPRGRV